MTLLDDARRLAEHTPIDYAGHDRGNMPSCWFCDRSGWEGDHDSDCPWLSMPRIVAALEAAEQILRIIAREQYHYDEIVRPTVDGKDTYSWCDTCDQPWPCRWSEAITAASTLETALRGDVVPSNGGLD